MNPATKSRFFDLPLERTRHALAAVKDIKGKKNVESEFAGQAKKLPMRILNAGLGHALLFIEAKADKKYPHPLLVVLKYWLQKVDLLDDKCEPSLCAEITKRDAFWLRQATAELLRYLEWLNRHAEAHDLKGLK